MDTKIARWAQMAFWEFADLTSYHAVEMAEEKKNLKILESCQPGTTSGAWSFQEFQKRNRRNNVEPFWPNRIPDGEQNRRIKDWECSIFPIWKCIVSDEERSSGGKIEYPDGDLLRKCDIAVWRSNIKPDRSEGASAKAGKERMQRLGGAYREAMT